MEIRVNNCELLELGKINCLLGKNGCGKSFLLRQIDVGLRNTEQFKGIRYISPERSGKLRYAAHVEQNMINSPDWFDGVRRQNQAENFKEQSAILFRRLELLELRSIERDHVLPGYKARTFEHTVDELNGLLDRVQLTRDPGGGFKIIRKEGGAETTVEEISSGESELISLGIELLTFVKSAEPEEDYLFLMDEPDVHLHPDLQNRLAHFIVKNLQDTRVTLILATHSTALLAGLAEKNNVRVAFMRRGDQVLRFKEVSKVDRLVLPIFGAHPLSNVFNEAPVLLVEGQDDERVWQQAVRSSQKKIRLYPCAVDGLAHFAEFEQEVNSVIESVYDDAKAYSLRDRDTQPELIDDFGHLTRMRLSCRAAENLMLADECLSLAGTDWSRFQEELVAWVGKNGDHRYHREIVQFVESDFDRKNHNLKNIRNILLGLLSEKPWEVLVGRTIAKVAVDGGANKEGSLRDFLGEKVCRVLLQIPG